MKLVAGEGKYKDKVYSFFAEKQKSKDGESEQWIPRVSQSCKVSRNTQILFYLCVIVLYSRRVTLDQKNSQKNQAEIKINASFES